MNDRGLFKTQSNVIPYRDTDLNAVIEILKDDQNLVLRESLWVIKLSHLPIGDIHVHFVLSQGLLWRNKTNLPKGSLRGKVQDCEKVDGGHGISATFYQWSISLKAC